MVCTSVNLLGKGENVVYLFPQCFQKAFSQVCLLFTKQQNFGGDLIESICSDKLNVAKMMISLFYRAENTMRKRENVGNQHFLLFPQCFLKPSSIGSLKVVIVWLRVKTWNVL